MILLCTIPGKKHPFLSVILLVSFTLWAQWDEIKFRQLSSVHGLSQNSGYCITQDKKGFVWIGTEAGLNRYDGYAILVYKNDKNNPNSLSNGFILSLCVDDSGLLWIGTENGLNVFNLQEERITRFFHDPGDPHSLSNDRIVSICEDTCGFIWIGTDCGLNRYDKKQKKFFRYYTFPGDRFSLGHNKVLSQYVDRRGILWVGTEGGGLNKYNRERNQFVRYQHIPGDTSSLSNNRVLCICDDTSGTLWIGTEGGGLNALNRENDAFTRYSYNPDDPNSINHDIITAVYEDQQGALWIATEGAGINLFDRKSGRFIHYTHDSNKPASICDNRILSIFEDFNGGIWFGSYNGGMSIFNRETQRFIHYKCEPGNPHSLSAGPVRRIYEDSSGILWIGTDGGGLNRIDRQNNTIKYYRHDSGDPYSLSNDNVFAVCEDRTGTLWVGTHGGGLDKFDRRSGRFDHYIHDPDDSTSLSNDKVRAIVVDSSGDLWIGTNGGGLNRFDLKKNRFIRYQNNPDDSFSLSNDRVYCVYLDRSSVLWAGTFGGGLNKFDREAQRFSRYCYDSNSIQSISNDFILLIYEDNAGTFLWIGTNNGGLNRFDRAKNIFTHYTTKNGLPDDVIYAIIDDTEGNLWMSSNRGLSKFNPDKGTFKNYDIKDGLQSNEFNTSSVLYSKRTGEMFFGGVNGFNAFLPNSLKDNPFIPSVVITGFQIFNTVVPVGPMEDGRTILQKPISETKEITLAHTDNVFTFEFTALHYVFPERNHYAFKMEGLERQWNYVGNRRYATYTTLPPGKYVFRVKGSNNDGVWNEEGTFVKITIIPPFWKTWWFYTLFAGVIMLLISGIFIYQLNRLKKQKQEEERRRVLETFNQVLEQGDATVYRRRFDSDVYDYIGEGIKHITGYEPGEFTVSFWKKIVLEAKIGGRYAGLSIDTLFEKVRDGKVDRWLSDLKLKTKNGDIKWVRDMTTALRDEKGNCYAVFGIVFDITDRRIAEQELARTSEELRISSDLVREKNREMEKDLNMAREVQMALLSQHYPRVFPPETKNNSRYLRFSHRYIPASTLAGDFFEIFPISDHKMGVLIYDVMGHGVRASLLTAYIHGLIEELMFTANDPVSFLKRLNVGLNAVIEQFFVGMFTTAFYLVADLQNGTMQYASAGHPVPYMLRRDSGKVEKLSVNAKKHDPALGLFKDSDYSCYTCSIADNETVFLYTDGLYEVKGRAEDLFGEERLMNSIRNHLGKQPEQMLDSVLGEVRAFAGVKEFDDDVCVVTMQVCRT